MTTKEINQTSRRKTGAAEYPSGSTSTSTSTSANGANNNPSIKRRQRPQTASADALASFHPAIAAWFRRRFQAPTDAQLAGWPEVRAGKDVLIAAPTGSGKTLAAFLVAIDQLLDRPLHPATEATMPRSLGRGTEENPPRRESATTTVLYVSPLKAL